MVNLEKYLEKASTLVEALPYIKKFSGKKIVVKYGGSSMQEARMIENIIEDIVLMRLIGMKPILVHGGGLAITQMLNDLQIKSEFLDGLRVTDEQTIDVVQMVLAGKINKNIVKLIGQHNLEAVGLSGLDANLLKVDKVKNGDIGFVGTVKEVNTKFINSLLDQGIIPVIAPIGIDDEGNTCNINADDVAAAIASSLKSEKLIFLTNVVGVLKDKEDPNSLITLIDLKDGEKLIKSKIISDGMIPKVDCCLKAVKDGVKNVHIIDGTIQHSMILELLTKKGIGTLFKEEK